jgi:hypothetical protein
VPAIPPGGRGHSLRKSNQPMRQAVSKTNTGHRTAPAEAVFTAYWAIKTTIDSRTFGVGYSADVFVLSETDGTFGTRQLSQAELEEMDDFIQTAKSAMRDFRDQLVPTPQTEAVDKSDEPPAMSDLGEPSGSD